MQRDIKINLATYCIFFGSAGYLLTAFAIPKLRELIRQRNQCSNNQIWDVSDVDKLLEQTQKDKINNEDGLIKLQIPVLIQGKLCTKNWNKQSTYNALDNKIPKDKFILQKKVIREILLSSEVYKKIQYSNKKVLHLQDFKNQTQKPLVVMHNYYLENLFTKKEFYFDRSKKNLLSFLFKPIQIVFDLFQTLGLRTLKIGLDEKIFAFSTNLPVYFFAKIYYHRESGQFFIVAQNKLCTSMKKLLIQFQKDILKMIGGIQVTLAISSVFLSIGLFLIKDKIQSKLIEIQQRKENKNLDKISQKFPDENKCIICFNNARNLLFQPCKHIALCSICFLEMKKSHLIANCPVCKQKIKKCIRVIYEEQQLIIIYISSQFFNFIFFKQLKLK